MFWQKTGTSEQGNSFQVPCSIAAQTHLPSNESGLLSLWVVQKCDLKHWQVTDVRSRLRWRVDSSCRLFELYKLAPSLILGSRKKYRIGSEISTLIAAMWRWNVQSLQLHPVPPVLSPFPRISSQLPHSNLPINHECCKYVVVFQQKCPIVWYSFLGLSLLSWPIMKRCFNTALMAARHPLHRQRQSAKPSCHPGIQTSTSGIELVTNLKCVKGTFGFFQMELVTLLLFQQLNKALSRGTATDS